jgi:hypothetical protein
MGKIQMIKSLKLYCSFMKIKNLIFLSIIILVSAFNTSAKDYYFHPKMGNDSANGTSFKSPFKSLVKISDLTFEPGDRILLAAGEVFYETLFLDHVQGSFENPILIDSYQINSFDTKEKSKIDATGLLNGLLITNASHVIIKNLDITANGPVNDTGVGEMRVGVLIFGKGNERITNIKLDQLHIHDIFYEKEGIVRSEAEVRSANGTQKYGWGIRLIANDNAEIENVWISNSSIENVSHTGIKLTGSTKQNIRNIRINGNKVNSTGGPGIQMSGVKFVHVKGNEVNYSGSTDDSRKWGRGSGLWTWSASHVMIEHNSFMHANGPGDSAGAHIDFNCDNIILQYNFSAENAGGFCEILGNNYNCAYRYNISVNDGHRIKGQNGAFQEGKIFWLSGYQGGQKPRKGPVNSYFYNNTIYVKADQVSKIAIDNRSKGILIANNIFHLEGPSELVAGDQYKPDDESVSEMERVFFENNLFLNETNWPTGIMIQDSKPLFGSAEFKNPGGMKPEDYIPQNKELIPKGIRISLLPNDEFGLMNGLNMHTDFLGNPIMGSPSLGAINYVEK